MKSPPWRITARTGFPKRKKDGPVDEKWKNRKAVKSLERQSPSFFENMFVIFCEGWNGKHNRPVSLIGRSFWVLFKCSKGWSCLCWESSVPIWNSQTTLHEKKAQQKNSSTIPESFSCNICALLLNLSVGSPIFFSSPCGIILAKLQNCLIQTKLWILSPYQVQSNSRKKKLPNWQCTKTVAFCNLFNSNFFSSSVSWHGLYKS